ncbi:MAG: bifunctional UDP-N-acetylglucosamine diphosphorylase/glucosamine-1-phosphate N-acetyltransferase GlmU [Pseudomonadota bacterium]
MKSPLHVVILAAGKGTRMNSALPKVLHPVGGKPMLGHVLDTAAALKADAVHIVHGHGSKLIRTWFEGRDLGGQTKDPSIVWVLQGPQLGTGHAVQQGMAEIPDAATVLVLYGDVPLIRAETLAPAIAAGEKTLALVTATAANPKGYGRILRDKKDAVVGIVEENDASDAELRITEINTGFLAAPAKKLRGWLGRINNDNAKKEFYLTDVVALAVKDGMKVATVTASEEDTLGVNDRAQLAQLERLFQSRQAQLLMQKGLALRDPARFDLRGTLKFGQDCSADVGVVMEGDIELGHNVSIGPYVVLKDVKLGDNTRVESHSVLEGVVTGRDCRIGPFARIRPETRLADEVRVGNFVEVKKSTLGAESKANHLGYIGDATIGARVNVGAGVITVNYDGFNKHPTLIGDDAFVGSDTQLIAPVKVGARATIGAGSTITKDVPAGGLTICRARDQRTLPKWTRPSKKKP